jgi:hypothetical protein
MVASRITRGTAATTAAGLLLGLGGCSTNSSVCSDNSCHVKVSLSSSDGAQTAKIWGDAMTVGHIDGNTVTVTVSGNQKTLSNGQRSPVGPYTVTVNSISGTKADLTVAK